jgi:hypothetical protein
VVISPEFPEILKSGIMIVNLTSGAIVMVGVATTAVPAGDETLS